jgi:hypothetical protein
MDAARPPQVKFVDWPAGGPSRDGVLAAVALRASTDYFLPKTSGWKYLK